MPDYHDGETPIPTDEAKRIAQEVLARPKQDDAPLEDELPFVDAEDPDEPGTEEGSTE